jgi:hypothetical protein
LLNPRDERVHDYSQRKGVERAELVNWEGTRQELWEQTELIETRKNARLAVEVEMSLPRELSPDQRQSLALSFAQELAAEYRAPVDVSVHNHRSKEGAEHPHVHVMIGCRTVEDGKLKDRVVPMDGPEEVTRWRERWADLQNLALERAGHDERVDHRTLAAQHEDARARVERAEIEQRSPEDVAQLRERADSLDRKPMMNLSRGAWQAEQRGVRTHVGEINRETANDNEERKRLLDQLRELKLVQQVERVVAAARERIGQGLERAGLRKPTPEKAPEAVRPMTFAEKLAAHQQALANTPPDTRSMKEKMQAVGIDTNVDPQQVLRTAREMSAGYAREERERHERERQLEREKQQKHQPARDRDRGGPSR